ncbi:hypothetical protein [Methylobacterium sp. Leaf108]|uniref:hypothetical protein n=1 Tax=Methylobacterium sp. Leaf108 TaxID=1736256 RepID=UPI000A8D5DF8|nr:hypothetical protein [Methylobacterium sp. Leaf108]
MHRPTIPPRVRLTGAALAGGMLVGALMFGQASAQTPPAQPPAVTPPATVQRPAQAAPPAAATAPVQRPLPGARPEKRRRNSYASCNRQSHNRGLRGGARRRFLVRCKLGYERPRANPASPAAPARQP